MLGRKLLLRRGRPPSPWSDLVTSFGALFGVPKPVIAMLHLGALPGRPQHDRAAGLESIVESVRRDLHALQDAGG